VCVCVWGGGVAGVGFGPLSGSGDRNRESAGILMALCLYERSAERDV
jgi:hypothetical protein